MNDNKKRLYVLTFTEAMSNQMPAGLCAQRAVDLTKEVPDEKILLPVRIEDVEDFADRFADLALRSEYTRAFFTSAARSYLKRMMNGEG